MARYCYGSCPAHGVADGGCVMLWDPTRFPARTRALEVWQGPVLLVWPFVPV
ncbi:MAG: hypothetical protein ACR5LD_00685 [Symbiopectobacterium sp.]